MKLLYFNDKTHVIALFTDWSQDVPKCFIGPKDYKEIELDLKPTEGIHVRSIENGNVLVTKYRIGKGS